MSRSSTPTNSNSPFRGPESRCSRHHGGRHSPTGRSCISSDTHSNEDLQVSLLGIPGGDVKITGGEYHAVGGNQYHLQVNLNGCHSEGPRRCHTVSMGSDVIDMDTESPHEVEILGKHASLPKGIHDLSKNKQTTLDQRVVEEINTTYFRCLAAKGRGTPLWIPEPNQKLSIDYQRNGLAIGDVGIITYQGWFDSLFNISLPSHHILAINSEDLPRNFSPFKMKANYISKYSMFKKDASLSSGAMSVEINDSSGLTFESSAPEGAILTLPDGSSSQDLRNTKKLREYLAIHLEEIYRCAMINHGREIKNGDLPVVTGFDKTTSWGMAAFLHPSSLTSPTFYLEFRPRAQGCGVKTHNWRCSGTAEVKAGPDTRETVALRISDPSQQDVEYENQTVFVRSENATLNP